MAFQFIHLEAYSRKADKGGRTTSFVFDEAERQPHACVHVENPEPPTVVHGCSISDLRMMHDQGVADAKTVNKDGKEKAIRIDQKTLLTVVASHPYTVAECKADASKMAEYEAWERDTVQWLRDQHGDNLKTVVRHSDESHMHIHAYVLPEHLKALEMHPGVSAKRKEKVAALDRGEDAKTANKSGDAAYKSSMREWQDSYFDKVATRHGLARLGPKLRRLSREEWQREKAAAQALKKATERAAVLVQKGNAYIATTKEQGKKYLETAKSDADKLKAEALEKSSKAKADADAAAQKKAEADALAKQVADRAAETNLLNEKAQKQASEASKMLKNARSEANRILSSAKARAEKLASFGSGIRALFTGFRIDKIRDQVNKEKAGEISAINFAKNLLQGALDRERDLRSETDNRLRNVSATLRDTSERLASAHAQISELTPKPKAKGRSSTSNYNCDDRDYSVSRGMKM